MTNKLLAGVEKELSAQPRPRRFSADIEERFEADTAPKRQRQLITGGLVALLIYDLFIFNDYALRPEDLGSAAVLRFGVMTPVGLLILWAVHLGQQPAIREGLMAATIAVAMLVSCLIFMMSMSNNALFDPFSFGLILLAGNVVFSLRFRHALVSSVTSIAIMALFLFAYERMTLDIKLYALMLAGTTGIFTLISNYRLETSERRSYLLLLRETLRASAALEDNEALTKISYTDPLTKLANRRQFDEAYSVLWNEACQSHGTLGMLMIDIDNFKSYNDHYGHPQGDRCLCQVANAMQRQVRVGIDLIARMGGEEFVVLIPGALPSTALHAAERIRGAIEALQIPHAGMAGAGTVTISIGIAIAKPAGGDTMAGLLAAADEALYRAKREGRNRAYSTAA